MCKNMGGKVAGWSGERGEVQESVVGKSMSECEARGFDRGSRSLSLLLHAHVRALPHRLLLRHQGFMR
jgi:hypothetical protein